VFAKSLATMDQISRGRVICSIGAGSNPPEYVAYGIPVFEHDERVAYLRELVSLFKQLWSHPAPEVTNFSGKHIRVHDLPFNPAPCQKPHIPIWIGGESDPTVAVLKDLADGWVTLTRSAAKAAKPGLAQRLLLNTEDRIKEVLAAPDWPKRPMTVVLQSQIFVAETREAAVADAKYTLGDLYGSMDGFINREIVGTPEECLERIAEIGRIGVNYLRVTFRDLSQQERVARLILPRLTEQPSPLYAPVG
jgi:FMNH2-dependent dimethyl sulfone monooxygenase